MTNIAVFASGNGSNCENLIRYFSNSSLGRVALVVSNRATSLAIQRAERLGVDTAIAEREQLSNHDFMLPMLEKHSVKLIVLAGFLPIIPDYLIEKYPMRIVNIHPSLLPKYGGKGMWGHHVHEAVKAAGDSITGMTVHYVSPVCDGGDIIAQFSVAISPDDSVDDIAEKEHCLEMKHYPKVVEEILEKI